MLGHLRGADVKRRKWDPETKAHIVLEGLSGRPVGELCNEFGLCPSQYYRWREILLERSPTVFEANRPDQDVAALQRENERLKRLVGELTLALHNGSDPGKR